MARWLVAQRWDDLLFAHWRADPAVVRRLLPPPVEPEVRDGAAWIGIVAFRMVGSRPHGGPRRLTLPPIPELNVRTYVRVDGVPGVWFLSLDAASFFFATVGRVLYGLRYRRARMLTAADGEAIHYLSAGKQNGFVARYEPSGPPAPARPGSLEHFLLERYRLFAGRRGRLMTATVVHEPWPLQPAVARIELNTMAPPGTTFEGEPLLHFSRSLEARISVPERLRVPALRIGAPVSAPVGEHDVLRLPA